MATHSYILFFFFFLAGFFFFFFFFGPLLYSYLGNPMDRGAWQATVHGVAEELDLTE